MQVKKECTKDWLVKVVNMIELESHHFATYDSIILEIVLEKFHFLLKHLSRYYCEGTWQM